MKKIPVPNNEAKRLKTIFDLGILDSLAEQEFDDLAVLASQICGCPMAFISIIDEERQWFKSQVGLGIKESPRAISFCTHTIVQNELYVVENAAEDPLFRDNPLVTGEAHIRFYAGIPIRIKGAFNIGTLAISDTKPHQLSQMQRDALERLSRQAISLIEAKSNALTVEKLNQSLAYDSHYFKVLANSLPAAVAYWDHNLHCQFANTQYLNKIRKNLNEVIGYHYTEVISEYTASLTKQHNEVILKGVPCEFELPQEYPDKDGKPRLGLCKYEPHFDECNQLLGFFVLVTDITSTKKAKEDQKLFSRIFNQTSNAILITDKYHKILSSNKAFLGLHGYSEEEVIGRTPEFLSADLATTQSIIHEINTRGSYEGMVWGKKKNGEKIYFRMSIDSILDSAGEVTHRVATMLDQTENFKIRTDLQIANEMLERTGKMSRIGGWEYDLNSGEVIWTDQLFEIHEVEPKITPKLETAINFYEPEARSLVREAVQKCIATGQPYDLEVPIITAKNNHLWVRTTGELIKRHGAGYKIAGTFQDITERKSRERQRIQDEINHRNTLVREVHHRIKNNLQGVSGILSQFATENPDYATPFNEANAQLQSVAVLYGLQGTTPDASINVSKLASAITQNIGSLWQTEIKFKMDIQCEPVLLSKSESVPIALILNELITNAVKHQTRENSVEIDLRFIKDKQNKLKNKISISILNDGDYIGPTDKQAKPNSALGLGLMSSLMPKSGAYIHWNIGEPRIRVELELSYPVILK
jgi:PAS domain S-box-containing protein